MAYRQDPDLAFLEEVPSADLHDLVEILTKGKDGELRVTEELTQSDEYQLHSPDHHQYWESIAAEIQRFGGNTIATMFRGGKGVLYKKVLQNVCKKMDVKRTENASVLSIEMKLMMKILEDSMKKMSPSERKKVCKDLDLKTTDYTSEGAVIALQTAIKLGGFAPYKVTVIVANAVVKALIGRGLSVAANATLTRVVGIFAGPVGWILTAGWTLIAIAGPAYRVTMPAVIMVAHLRRQKPIKMSSDVCERLPPVLDKFVVDLANSIDVAKGHVDVQRERSSFGGRLYDGLTGRGALRQANINTALSDGVEGALHLLNELARDLASKNDVVAGHSLAITRVERVVADIATNAATRAEIGALADELSLRLQELEAWVARVEAKSDANDHIARILKKWEAGRFAPLSILGRCYAAFEELRWGEFGHYLRSHAGNHKELLAYVVNGATTQMMKDAELREPRQRQDTKCWLEWPDSDVIDGLEALAYLGDDHHLATAPFVALASRGQWSADIPRQIDPERLASALANEIFEAGGGNQA